MASQKLEEEQTKSIQARHMYTSSDYSTPAPSHASSTHSSRCAPASHSEVFDPSNGAQKVHLSILRYVRCWCIPGLQEKITTLEALEPGAAGCTPTLKDFTWLQQVGLDRSRAVKCIAHVDISADMGAVCNRICSPSCPLVKT